MRRCGEPHPEAVESVCIQPEGRHLDHVSASGLLWPNTPVVEALARAPQRRTKSAGRRRGDASAQAKERIRAIAAKAAPERRVNPLADGRRGFNGPTKEQAMDTAEASVTSADDRTTFFLAMAEVATTRASLTTNDAWDLLEARGWQRTGHANYVGVVGRMGASIGLWEATEERAKNTSGNFHSADDGVRVYRSLVCGADFAQIAPLVIERAAPPVERP